MRTHTTALLASALIAAALAGCGGKDDATSPKLGKPVLLTINQATRPSGPSGSTVILQGWEFGATQGAGQVLFSNGTGGSVAATVSSPADWSNSFILTTVPSAAATGPVWVQTEGGVSDSVTFTITQNAAFSPSTIAWSGTTPLPAGLSGHAAVFAPLSVAADTGMVYVMGGAGDTNVPRADVLYARVLADGQLAAWTATVPLPAAVAFHKAVVATPFNSLVQGAGFLYVLGGATDAAGQPAAGVYRGALNADGTVASWTSLGALPDSVHSFGATIFLGRLYVAGGATTGNAPVATAWQAAIDTQGGLGAWEALPALPSARAYFGFLSAGGSLYAFGGETAVDAPNDSTNTATHINEIAYARVDLRTGLIGSWLLNPSSMTKAVSKHTVVLSGGYVLSTAGIYNGAKNGASEESYAQVGSDGTVGSFNGATGSHTIVSAGGVNLFNHAALSYIDGSGAAHVLVVGGDNLNHPGQKSTQVWFY